MHKILVLTLLLTLSACSTPEFSKTGTPSSFDGIWKGELIAKKVTCQGLSTNFEIRYGKLIGVVRKDGVNKADLWGDLSENGELEGLIGQLGVSGGKANIKFSKNTATGTWSGSGCSGVANLKRS